MTLTMTFFASSRIAASTMVSFWGMTRPLGDRFQCVFWRYFERADVESYDVGFTDEMAVVDGYIGWY